jgi:hypothetical protein
MKKQQLLNEIMGVPKSVDFWVDYFSLILSGMAKGIISQDEIEEKSISYQNEEGEEVEANVYRGRTKMEGKEFTNWVVKLGGYADLKELIKDPRFKQFPLYNPTVSLTLMFLPKEILDIEIKNRVDTPDFVSAHHSFDSSKKSISKLGPNEIFVKQEFGFEVTLSAEQLDNLDLESFKKQIKPTVSHELTHAYELYNRIKTSGDPYQGREAMLNAAVRLMDDKKYPQWRDFLHLIYLHLGFELNARVTQFYYSIKDKDIKTTEEFMDALKKSGAWREVQMLEDFDAEKFIKSFKSEKLDFFSMMDDIGRQIERQQQGLPKINPTKTPKQGMRHLIQGWDYVLQMLNTQLAQQGLYKGKFMELVPTKAMEDPYYFFKFFEQRFHKKADNFKRKLYRIGSLVTDKSLMGND